ncbi:hypothetical protein EDC01DRAFT_730080 [Geopyxis carbonaria]|nr:hypothetical protein EDC01DRAFT_730080 [Geopyxis carbonaria]
MNEPPSPSRLSSPASPERTTRPPSTLPSPHQSGPPSFPPFPSIPPAAPPLRPQPRQEICKKTKQKHSGGRGPGERSPFDNFDSPPPRGHWNIRIYPPLPLDAGGRWMGMQPGMTRLYRACLGVLVFDHRFGWRMGPIGDVTAVLGWADPSTNTHSGLPAGAGTWQPAGPNSVAGHLREGRGAVSKSKVSLPAGVRAGDQRHHPTWPGRKTPRDAGASASWCRAFTDRFAIIRSAASGGDSLSQNHHRWHWPGARASVPVPVLAASQGTAPRSPLPPPLPPQLKKKKKKRPPLRVEAYASAAPPPRRPAAPPPRHPATPPPRRPASRRTASPPPASPPLRPKALRCPKCGKCNSRTLWKGWKCTNCEFEHNPKNRICDARRLADPWVPVGVGEYNFLFERGFPITM